MLAVMVPPGSSVLSSSVFTRNVALVEPFPKLTYLVPSCPDFAKSPESSTRTDTVRWVTGAESAVSVNSAAPPSEMSDPALIDTSIGVHSAGFKSTDAYEGLAVP